MDDGYDHQGMGVEGVTWAVDSGDGKVGSSSQGRATLTAGGNDGAIVVTANVQGRKKQIDFVSIKPSGIQAVVTNPVPVRGTSYSKASADLELTILPTSVSFGNVKIQEHDGGSTGPQHPNMPGQIDTIGSHNKLNNLDQISATKSPPYLNLTFTWQCEWKYTCDQTTDLISGQAFPQVFTETPVTINGLNVMNIEVTKFGVGVNNHSVTPSNN